MGHDAEETAILAAIISNPSPWVNRKSEWKYLMRRQAQAILTFIQLGPSSASRDLETLKRDGVTMLLVIRNTSSAHASLLSGDKPARTLGIESRAVDVASNSELIAAIPHAIRIIHDHLISQYRKHAAASHNGAVPEPCAKILVFCESGNERSAAFMTAYLMNTFGMGLVPALQYVQAQRFCVALDDGLKHMLQAFQDILGAQRSLLDAAPVVASDRNSSSRLKRSRDDTADGDGDVVMALGDDVRFEGGRQFAPFR